MNRKTYAVLGLGLFGSSLARTLTKNGVDVIAIDQYMDLVEAISEDIDTAIQADFTKMDALLEAGIGQCDTAIIASSAKLENSILAILNLQAIGVPHIICKTRKVKYEEVLKKVGAHQVILPEVEMGVRVGNELSGDSILDRIHLDDRYQIVEFKARPRWNGKTIQQLDLRKKFDVNIIALKKQQTKEFTIDISPNHIVQEDDIFVGLSSNEQINELLR